MTNIVLGISPALSVAVRSKNTVVGSLLYEILDRHDLVIVGPSISVGDTIHYYTIENVDAEISDGLVSELTMVPGVEAAFIKPSDELP